MIVYDYTYLTTQSLTEKLHITRVAFWNEVTNGLQIFATQACEKQPISKMILTIDLLKNILNNRKLKLL
jgi:predicted DNA-binding protein (UPF0251 family)